MKVLNYFIISAKFISFLKENKAFSIFNFKKMSFNNNKRKIAESFDDAQSKKEKNLNINEKLSPHTLQNKNCVYSLKEFTAECRLITDESPRQKYQRRSKQDKTTFHFGQRKLMLSEIEFLTNVSKELSEIDKKICLLYAGAAPDIHIAMLINMFPFIEYILVGPAKFEMDISKPIAKYKLTNDFFSD